MGTGDVWFFRCQYPQGVKQYRHPLLSTADNNCGILLSLYVQRLSTCLERALNRSDSMDSSSLKDSEVTGTSQRSSSFTRSGN